MNSFESVATDFLLVGNQAFIAGWNFNNACMWSQTNDVFLNGTVRTNSALNKDWYVLAVGDSCYTPPNSQSGTGSVNPNKAPFRLLADGTLHATNAHIKGEITATSGSFTGSIYASSGNIAQFNISNELLKYPNNIPNFYTYTGNKLAVGPYSEFPSTAGWGESLVTAAVTGGNTAIAGFVQGTSTTNIYGGCAIYGSERPFDSADLPPSQITGFSRWAGYFDGKVYADKFTVKIKEDDSFKGLSFKKGEYYNGIT